MGKASSAKKVARAARAGGSRRPGQRRALGFPLLIIGVVVLGTLLVVFARESREANAEPRSQADGLEAQHWHAAYGLSFCGEFQRQGEGQALVDVGADTLGIHTHGDSVIHIHPFIDSAGGRNARMRIFLDQVGIQFSDSRFAFPDGETWDEAEDTCTVDGEEVPGQLAIARWQDAQDAADGERPNEVITDDFGDIRFRNDREYYTFAFVPEGQLEDIPVRPDIIADLGNLVDVGPSEDLEAPPDSTSTTLGDTTGDTTDTTATGDTTDTTATGDTTDTTAAGDAGTTDTTAAGDAGTTSTTAAG
jgi:hypothetical protein